MIPIESGIAISAMVFRRRRESSNPSTAKKLITNENHQVSPRPPSCMPCRFDSAKGSRSASKSGVTTIRPMSRPAISTRLPAKRPGSSAAVTVPIALNPARRCQNCVE